MVQIFAFNHQPDKKPDVIFTCMVGKLHALSAADVAGAPCVSGLLLVFV